MEFTRNKLIKWTANIEQYINSFQHEDDSANKIELLKAYIDTMADILTEIARKTTPNDNWNLFLNGDVLEIRSNKLQHGVRFYTWRRCHLYVLEPHAFADNQQYAQQTDGSGSNGAPPPRFWARALSHSFDRK